MVPANAKKNGCYGQFQTRLCKGGCGRWFPTPEHPHGPIEPGARSLKFIATCVGKIYKQQKNKILTEQNLKIVATYLGKNSDSNRTGLSHRFDT